MVPVYFSMFVLSGVAASAFAFDEVRFPWVLLLLPGIVLCVAGVFCIAHDRDQRSERSRTGTDRTDLTRMSTLPPLRTECGPNGHGPNVTRRHK